MPNSTDPIAAKVAETLRDAKVIHLEPDDVVVFTNVGAMDQGQFSQLADGLRGALGTRRFVVCGKGIDVQALRDGQVVA